MPSGRPQLTPSLIAELCERIKAGAFEQVAAESLGVPYALYQRWLARGRAAGAAGSCRKLYRAVLQAKAHARFMAEMDLRTSQPKVWLLQGPGKECGDLPGWSQPPRARRATDTDALDVLTHPEVVALFRAVDEALTPFPEARAAVVRVLTPADAGRRSPPSPGKPGTA